MRLRWLVLPIILVSTLAADDNHERDFLTRVRRLTVEGKRAGEGYWSPDGKRLVFQSEREPGNPFYQIYTLDLATGESKRVSPGIGKTTKTPFAHQAKSAATPGTTTRRWTSIATAKKPDA